MSVAGRNRWRGVVCHHKRATETSSNGALQKTWSTVATDLRLELQPVTGEMSRQIFGAETNVELTALVPSSADIRLKDGILPQSGAHNGKRFLCTAHRPFRKLTELGFTSTTESMS